MPEPDVRGALEALLQECKRQAAFIMEKCALPDQPWEKARGLVRDIRLALEDEDRLDAFEAHIRQRLESL